MLDRRTARVLASGRGFHDFNAVGFRDAAIDVRCNRDLAGAGFQVRRECVQAGDAVHRYTDHGGTGGDELVVADCKFVRLDIAFAGEGARKEIEHDGPLPKGILQ